MNAIRLAVLALLITGCATTGSDGVPLTTQEKIRNCSAMAATVGILCGLASGEDDRVRNGLTCGALASAGCAVWYAFLSPESRQRIARLEQQAAATGETQQASWTEDDGIERTVVVESGEAMERTTATGARVICRHRRTLVSAGGRQDETTALVCRGPDGTYVEETGIS